MSERVVQSLARPPTRSRLKRIIYVSCGYDAFRREAGELVNSGNWKVVGAEGFVLFPGTDHVEILAVFDRPFLPKLEKEEEEEAEEEAGKVVGDARNRNGRGKGRRVKDKPVDTTRKKGTAPPMGRGRKTVGEGRPGGGKRGGRGWGK